MSFWNTLQRPFMVLAPMADVTDAPFRRLIARESAHQRDNGTHGGPDVMWTEFVSADGLMRADAEGQRKLRADLIYTEAERPIVAQLFSSSPKDMEGAARLVKELGFDGIDINMGCPDRSIERQGAGAAMIRNPDAARAVIEAAMCGVGGTIPVSVKTRLGYSKDELETWLPSLLSTGVAAITLHARTRKEMSLVPARWERVMRAVEIRNSLASKTLIIGNGDARSRADAHEKALVSGADGVMLGRAIFGNPWLFHPERDVHAIPLTERLSILVEHSKLFEELLPHKSFAIMKKHYKAYVQGFDGARELRMQLMNAGNADEVADCAKIWLAHCGLPV